MPNTFSFAFFGTSEFAVIVLSELKKKGFTPKLVITTPDAPKGRKLVMTPPPAKVWATENSVPVFQPETLKDISVEERLRELACDVFIVASYGKIIPENIFSIPPKRTLNIHPSLLPRWRGASPIQSSILADDKELGVTIIELDTQMDHGPIIASKQFTPSQWPLRRDILEKALAQEGTELLVEILPDWIDGNIHTTPQNDLLATYTKKISKEDGLLDFADDPYKNLLKIKAFYGWPTAYFFTDRNGTKIRLIVTEANFEGDVLNIKKVIPEGKREMSYADFLNG